MRCKKNKFVFNYLSNSGVLNLFYFFSSEETTNILKTSYHIKISTNEIKIKIQIKKIVEVYFFNLQTYSLPSSSKTSTSTVTTPKKIK